ncbi:MAG: hypothetical protein AAGB26_15320 [Planctomycetota bacterium]
MPRPYALRRDRAVPEPAQTHNLNVKSLTKLIGPAELAEEIPISDLAQQTVIAAREEVKAVIHGDDPRLLVVIGPCSIHDVDAAMEYAERLQKLRDELKELFPPVPQSNCNEIEY